MEKKHEWYGGLGLGFVLMWLFTEPSFSKVVVYSVYCDPQPQACGGRFHPNAMTVAHRTFKCGTKLKITHGKRSVIATVTDRGPYVRGRGIDLSCGVARKLHIHGLGKVKVERVKGETK